MFKDMVTTMRLLAVSTRVSQVIIFSDPHFRLVTLAFPHLARNTMDVSVSQQSMVRFFFGLK